MAENRVEANAHNAGGCPASKRTRKTSIIRTPTTSLKTSIKTITNLSDTNCLEIQGASLATLPSITIRPVGPHVTRWR